MSNADTNQKLIFIKPYQDGNQVAARNRRRLGQYSESDDEGISESGRVKRRWLILTIALCFVLGSALIYSFIRYKNLQYAYDHDMRTSSRQQPISPFQTVNDTRSLTTHLTCRPNMLNVSRLPHDVKPLHYNLKLRIDVNNFAFSGYCEIRVQCFRSTKFIFLHSEALLKHDEAPVVLDMFQNQLSIVSIHVNDMFSYLIIELADLLAVDNIYTIIFKSYQAPILNDLKGLYSSSYKLSNGTTK
jgi:hypothetical protein